MPRLPWARWRCVVPSCVELSEHRVDSRANQLPRSLLVGVKVVELVLQESGQGGAKRELSTKRAY